MKWFSILIVLCAFGCKNKDCVKDSKCNDKVPTGVTCQAYFESWIYDSNKNECEFIGYSGCNAVGFESQEECEKCECED